MARTNALTLAAGFGLGVAFSRFGLPGWLKDFLESTFLGICSPSLKLQLLQDQLTGTACFFGEGEKQMRSSALLYNALFQGRGARSLPRPFVLVVAANTADVEKAVQFAHDHKLKVSVKGSGHSFAGTFFQEGALILDVSRLKTISVNKDKLTARVGAGVVGLELYTTLAMWGLHFPGPYISCVGLSGFLLGGGLGRGKHAFGASCDSVMAMEVIDGRPGARLQMVDAEVEPDLFWGLRGGGSFLGVVTEFTVQLRHIAPKMHTYDSMHPYDAAPQVFQVWAEFSKAGPPTLDFTLAMVRGSDGLPGIVLDATGYGPPDHPADAAGIAKLSELAHQLPTMSTSSREAAPLDVFTAMDSAWTDSGAVVYAHSIFVAEVTDDVIAILLSHFLRCAAPRTQIIVEQSPPERMPPSAFGFRGMYHIGVYCIWKRTEEGPAADGDRLHAGWVRGLAQALEPHTRGSYINEFMFEPDDDPSQCFEHEAWSRLKEVKAVYDPKSMFRPLAWRHERSWL